MREQVSLPTHVGRSSEQILSERSYFDSVGYLYRAMSWLDYFERSSHWPALLYSCIEGRFGIEYLLFEELVIATGAKLSQEEYQKCVAEPRSLAKAISRLIPDYDKLQQFTAAIVSLEPSLPKMISWRANDLMKSWGKLSAYLHWTGHRVESAENAEWKRAAGSDVRNTLAPIWDKITSGFSACMPPDQMNPEIREIWQSFKDGATDIEGATIRLNLIKPLLTKKYANPVPHA